MSVYFDIRQDQGCPVSRSPRYRGESLKCHIRLPIFTSRHTRLCEKQIITRTVSTIEITGGSFRAGTHNPIPIGGERWPGTYISRIFQLSFSKIQCHTLLAVEWYERSRGVLPIPDIVSRNIPTYFAHGSGASPLERRTGDDDIIDDDGG
ncbi:MAG: hypothetical protein IPG82_10195 [Saprospiraceae bacterium]|nr:hypothetical protein [Saprospiraceae bacterium]